MFFPRKNLLKIIGTAAAISCLGGSLWADEEEQASSDADEQVEEIVVVARKPGDPIDVESKNEALLRARILTEMARLRVLKDEYAWRKLGADDTQDSSRIKWGYDPKDEMRMRLKSDLMDIDAGNTRPATIVRVEF